MLGALIAAGFGSLMLSNPRRKKRRRSVVDPFTGRRVSIKSIKAKMGGTVRRKSMRGMKAMVKGADGVWRMNPRRRNPSAEARELALFIVNDGALYRQQAQPIITNLRKKIAKGTYDAAKALKLWGYLADAGAKKYTFEFGPPTKASGGTGSSFGVFTAADRRETAKELADSYEEELRETNPRRSRKWRKGGTKTPALKKMWKKRWGHGRRVTASGYKESSARSRRRARR